MSWEEAEEHYTDRQDCIVYRPTQPPIPPGSVNEYQLQLERQMQVWFIPLVDKHGVCHTWVP